MHSRSDIYYQFVEISRNFNKLFSEYVTMVTIWCTYRLYPIVCINARVMTEDTSIGGHVLPKGVGNPAFTQFFSSADFLILSFGNSFYINIQSKLNFMVGGVRMRHILRTFFFFQTCVLVNNYTMSRDKDIFENPDEFIPERWSREDNQKWDPFAVVPFGFGSRSCLGECSIFDTTVHTTIQNTRHDNIIIFRFSH